VSDKGRGQTVVCGHRFCANNPHREAHNGPNDWTCFTCRAGEAESAPARTLTPADSDSPPSAPGA
jgi:hypothetical protein